MKDILNKIIETVKSNKQKIKKTIIIIFSIAIIGSGIAAGSLYTYAKSNTNYSENQMKEIAIKKIPGEVINIKKEFEIEDATFEYTFFIKNKENILQEITISSKSGAITDIDINGDDSDDNDHYDD